MGQPILSPKFNFPSTLALQQASRTTPPRKRTDSVGMQAYGQQQHHSFYLEMQSEIF